MSTDKAQAVVRRTLGLTEARGLLNESLVTQVGKMINDEVAAIAKGVLNGINKGAAGMYGGADFKYKAAVSLKFKPGKYGGSTTIFPSFQIVGKITPVDKGNPDYDEITKPEDLDILVTVHPTPRWFPELSAVVQLGKRIEVDQTWAALGDKDRKDVIDRIVSLVHNLMLGNPKDEYR